MKKILSIFVLVAMLATLTVSAFAADNDFISSPGKQDPEIVKVTDSKGNDLSGEIEFVDYSDRNNLPGNKLNEFEASYDVIKGTDDISKITDVSKLTDGGKVNSKDLAVSDLFYLDTTKDNTVIDGDNYTVVLKVDNLDKFAGLIEYIDGKWSVVDGAYVNADGHLVVTTTKLAPDAYAVVSKTATATAPQTGDASIVFVSVALVAIAAASVVVIKRRENA